MFGYLALDSTGVGAQAPGPPAPLPAPALVAPTPAPAIDAVPPQPQSTLALRREVVARGLRHPWSMAFLPNGDFLVTEKDGTLQRVTPTGRLSAIGGVPDDLDNTRQDPRDNSGLFDVVLHPQFPSNGLLYLAYASRRPDGTTTKLVRARLDGQMLTEVRTLFQATPRTGDRFHYGGALLIGPDQKLYLSVGERHFRESDNPPLGVSQDISDRRGKIYRFDLDGGIPSDNPTSFGALAVPGLYAIGVRAPQGFAIQPDSRRIWFTDHGSSRGDEINVLTAGANYGWPSRTFGTFREADYVPVSLPGARYTDPVHVWADRTVAPTGLAFYTGNAFPELRGELLVAGLSRGYLMRIRVEGATVLGVEYLLEDAPVRLRNIKQAPDGGLYLLTDEADGKLIRLVRGTKVVPDP